MNAFTRVCRLGLALLIMAPAWAAETGTMLKADAMRAAPFGDAKTLATLPVGSKVTILKKNGGWFQVKSAKASGWVRMLSIRTGGAPKKAGTAAGVLGLASDHRDPRTQRRGSENGPIQRDGTQTRRVLCHQRGGCAPLRREGQAGGAPLQYLSAPQ